MAQPELVEVFGAVRSGSCCYGVDSSGLQEVASLFTQVAYGASKMARPSINSPNPGVFPIPLEGILKVRFIWLAVLSGGTFRLRMTSPNGGADQVVPVSDKFLLHAPSSGDEVTALSLSGVGDVAYFLAGDVA